MKNCTPYFAHYSIFMGLIENISEPIAKTACYHCGDTCKNDHVIYDDKDFCCNGCKTVYDLLKDNELCAYYNFENAPGISPGRTNANNRFDYLDNPEIANQLLQFTDQDQTHITFFIPKIHCTSCIWLLENLHRIDHAIADTKVNFLQKEVQIIFNHKDIKLSEIANLLSSTGYEPLIRLNDMENTAKKVKTNTPVIKIAIAGFCFGNIMMLSFPEYFSLGDFFDQKGLSWFFGLLNLTLAIPVFSYCASEFFVSAWKGIRYRFLTIDAPIALAILVTFLRSVYEILNHSGAGYLDSMTGIVFFMLLGRYFQNKTYDTLSFDRDYKSYFPVAVAVFDSEGNTSPNPVTSLKKNDRILIRNNELIPVDSTLLSDFTHVDYSFITGESNPVKKIKGDLIYAGGRQLDGAIELEVEKVVSQSYLTKLWNKDGKENQSKATFVDSINLWFTLGVFTISIATGLFWFFADPSKILNSMTAVLIVACPCGLLLTSSFAHGNLLRVFGRNKFYIKNASIINELAKAEVILFDKTGTITKGNSVLFEGSQLTHQEIQMLASLAAQSSHPLSQLISGSCMVSPSLKVQEFKEVAGKGIQGKIENHELMLGSNVYLEHAVGSNEVLSTSVYLKIDQEIKGCFRFQNRYRDGLKNVVESLESGYQLAVISGDNASEKNTLAEIFGQSTPLLFNLQPEEKRQVVEDYQQQEKRVVMIGDGLNDAGALNSSNAGITISDDTNTFSPACDAILDGSSFHLLPAFFRLAKVSKKIIVATFVFSVVYNMIGLYFAVKGELSPVLAAILMPASTISIVLITTILTSLAARKHCL